MPLPRRLTFRFRAKRRADLTLDRILNWADAFHARFRRWPTRVDGTRGLSGTSWPALDSALRNGLRGLPGGTTLARLLLERRGVRHWSHLPPLTATRILAWADAHHARTGRSTAPGRSPRRRARHGWRSITRCAAAGAVCRAAPPSPDS